MSGKVATLPKPQSRGEIAESVIIKGDLAQLTPEERTSYYMKVCESVGLNPLTKPFEYITLNGKLRLYALKDCTDQLRKIHEVSIAIADRAKVDDVFVVTARATDASGRADESTGAVALGNLKGEALANAMMKAETKAKRRVTLSICGLGLLDETEVEDIPGARPEPKPAPPPRSVALPPKAKYCTADSDGLIIVEHERPRSWCDEVIETLSKTPVAERATYWKANEAVFQRIRAEYDAMQGKGADKVREFLDSFETERSELMANADQPPDPFGLDEPGTVLGAG